MVGCGRGRVFNRRFLGEARKPSIQTTFRNSLELVGDYHSLAKTSGFTTALCIFQLSPMKITRQAFFQLFAVHIPRWSESAWVKGVRYVFVAGTAEIEELERLLGGVTSGKT